MAQARKLMVIRHAEKPPQPPDAPPPNGVDADGNVDPESLTPQGWQRAGALVRLFNPVHPPSDSAIAVPNVLIASSKNGRGSKRPFQTLTPLAQDLHLDITTFGPNNFDDAVVAAKASDGVVLMCWQHEDIPEMGAAIAGDNVVPAQWPGARFDIVWVFDRDPQSGTYSFTQVPQRLLAGDLTTIID